MSELVVCNFETPYVASGDSIRSLSFRRLIDGDSKYYLLGNEEQSTEKVLKATLKQINDTPVTDKQRELVIGNMPVPYAEHALYRICSESDPFHDVTIGIVCSKCSGVTELPAVFGVEEVCRSIELTTDLELREPLVTRWKNNDVTITHITIKLPTLGDYIAAERMRLTADADAVERAIRTRCVISSEVIFTSGLIEQLSIADRRRWKSWINRQQILSYQQEGVCKTCGSTMVYRREHSPFFV